MFASLQKGKVSLYPLFFIWPRFTLRHNEILVCASLQGLENRFSHSFHFYVFFSFSSLPPSLRPSPFLPSFLFLSKPPSSTFLYRCDLCILCFLLFEPCLSWLNIYGSILFWSKYKDVGRVTKTLKVVFCRWWEYMHFMLIFIFQCSIITNNAFEVRQT